MKKNFKIVVIGFNAGYVKYILSQLGVNEDVLLINNSLFVANEFPDFPFYHLKSNDIPWYISDSFSCDLLLVDSSLGINVEDISFKHLEFVHVDTLGSEIKIFNKNILLPPLDFETRNIEGLEVGNILVTSVSDKVPLIRSIREATLGFMEGIKIYGIDLHHDPVSKYFLDGFYQQKSKGELFINEVLEICVRNSIKHIIPTRDGELEFFSKNKAVFNNEGIDIFVSELSVIETCLDKLKFFNVLGAYFDEIIPTFSDSESFSDNDVIVVKERLGAGSHNLMLGVHKTSFEQEKFESPIFQPHIEGEEFSIDSYYDGDFLISCCRRRTLVKNGESQITEEVMNDEFQKIVQDIIKKFNIKGHSVFQAIIDSNEKIHIIECNSRFGGASSFSVAAGVDTFTYYLFRYYFKKMFTPFYKSDEILLKQVRYKNDMILSAKG
ncbi:MAG: ATP-grasp domain-containing protein [Bacteriovoracaceae bacterium]